jgi:AAA15 family ATPase/GTPase
MIRDISIQNFRCFENTSISGFKNVNLITGKNNAGKTALLESLFVANSPRPETIISLKRYRRESPEFEQTLPESSWDSLFFNQDKSKKISIQINEERNLFSKVDMFINNELADSLVEIDESNNTSGRIAKRYIDPFLNNKSKRSGLQISVTVNNNTYFEASLLATSQNIAVLPKNVEFPNIKNVSLILASDLFLNIYLANEYDKARFNHREKEVLNGFQIIDPSIQVVESFNIGSPMIYLQKEDRKRFPLSLFGDAINRVAAIILSMVNNHSSVLLIDEIENGVHHTSQAKLWEMIFRLAKELNVQIFATTHSLEMLTAFTKVGLESEFSDLAAHFEMARSIKTNQIIGIRRDMETLEYSLSHDRGVRGE